MSTSLGTRHFTGTKRPGKTSREPKKRFKESPEIDEIPNELLTENMRRQKMSGTFANETVKFAPKDAFWLCIVCLSCRTCQRWSELLRVPRILSVAKLDIGILMGLKTFRDGSEDLTASGVEHVVLVADSPGRMFHFSKRYKRHEEFIWRFGWFLRCQALNARSLILDGLVIPYSLFVAIVYLDFRPGLKLIIRNVGLMRVSCEQYQCEGKFHAGDVPSCSKCQGFLEVAQYENCFPHEKGCGSRVHYGPNGCLLRLILRSGLSADAEWTWPPDDFHRGCCQYDKDGVFWTWRPYSASVERTKGKMKINVQTLTGKTIVLHVSPSAYIGDIKEMIQERVGIPPDEQRIIFSEKELPDWRTLWDFNVQEGATFHLKLSLVAAHYPSTFLPLYIRISQHNTVGVTFPKFSSCGLTEEITKEIEKSESIPASQQRLRHKVGQSEGADCSLPRGTVLTLNYDYV